MFFVHFMWHSVTTCRSFFSSFVQGYLPGLILKGFMLLTPHIVMFLSKCEGHLAHSRLEHEAASKYYYFVVVNVFFGSILTGSAFSQLSTFINSSSIIGWANYMWNHEYNCSFSHVHHNTSRVIHQLQLGHHVSYVIWVFEWWFVHLQLTTCFRFLYLSCMDDSNGVLTHHPLHQLNLKPWHSFNLLRHCDYV